MEIDLTLAVGHLFYHNPTYSYLDIAQRITEDYHIIRSWPHRSAVYPVTICWEPYGDQTPSEDP
jgi:hypothetical protein